MATANDVLARPWETRRERTWAWPVFTGLLLAATLLAAVVTGTYRTGGHLSAGTWLARAGTIDGPTLQGWRLVKLVPTVALTKDKGNVLGVSWKLLFFVGALEMYAGTKRTLAAFWATNAAGYLGAYLLVALPLASSGDAWGRRWFHAQDVGASAGAFGAAAALTQLLPMPWPLLTLPSLLLYLATTFKDHWVIWDVEHLVAIGVGVLLGVGWRWAEARARRRVRPTPRAWGT